MSPLPKPKIPLCPSQQKLPILPPSSPLVDGTSEDIEEAPDVVGQSGIANAIEEF